MNTDRNCEVSGKQSGRRSYVRALATTITVFLVLFMASTASFAQNSKLPATEPTNTDLPTPPATDEESVVQSVTDKIANDNQKADAQKKDQKAKTATTPVQAPPPGTSDATRGAGQATTNPYQQFSALQDLYKALPSANGSVERFGARLFAAPTGGESLTDIPADSNYVLGPGDSVDITLYGSVNQKFTRVVDHQGRVLMPEVGSVMVAGKSIDAAQQLVFSALDRVYNGVKVDLSLSKVRVVRIYVVGEVARPGAYDISALSTALSAVIAAGGPTQSGSYRTLKHFRGKDLVEEVDLYDLLLHGVRTDLQRLQSGDSILIPTVGAQVEVDGTVRRPAVYELRDEKNLGEVLSLAGGVPVGGSYGRIEVDRVDAHERRVTSNFLSKTSNDADLDKSLREFSVRDGDRVIVSTILPYEQDTIYLDGKVYRPGKFPFHPGMKVSDLIHSYDELMPEPGHRAELIRLAMPTRRPVVSFFDLDKALSGEVPIELQPMDTVRIFGRYELDPPKASVYGEVMNPGSYPMAEGMKASELIALAGGFRRGAYRHEADLVSSSVVDGAKVVSERSVVDLARVGTGDADSDPTLKPGDVLTIRQIPGYNDLGAFVSVDGEVTYPSSYGLEDGERLSSILKRAGGFREGAYPEAIVLERVEVRQMSERSRRELMNRIRSEMTSAIQFAPGASDKEREDRKAQTLAQQQQVLANLAQQPATGRLVVNITHDISKWANGPNDPVIRNGDSIHIPKIPGFVLVTGQVNNQTALLYQKGRSAAWYLQHAGGARSKIADVRNSFIIRANGSVEGRGASWWHGDVLSATMRPGDMIVVPDKVVGSDNWKHLEDSAQVMSAIALAAAVALRF